MNNPFLLALACLAASLPVHAETFKPIELKDQELATLRGRYVMPGRIVSFGIVMSSTWQNASAAVGCDSSARAMSDIQFRGAWQSSSVQTRIVPRAR